MKMRSSCLLLVLRCVSIVLPVIQVQCETPLFVADIEPINNSSVVGTVTVFITGNGEIAYAGFAGGLEENLEASQCTAENGCGVHIHNGTSCENKEKQGGHYYNASLVTSDPWADERYSSDSTGVSYFGSILNIGTDYISGKPFIVHTQNGSRAGCGLLTGASQYYQAALSPLPNSTSSGAVWGYVPATKELSTGGIIGNDVFCFYADGENLTNNIKSVLSDTNGTDCNYENGCGVHVHNGTSCESKETQGGHYYNHTELSSDPWVNVSYRSTDSVGNGSYAACVATGESDYLDKPFILHSDTGSRVACGLLHLETGQPSSSAFVPDLRYIGTTIVVSIVYNFM